MTKETSNVRIQEAAVQARGVMQARGVRPTLLTK